MTNQLLNASGLNKRFDRDVALRQASIAVETGEIVAILGPSGCGKSTLLHCLATIIRPDGGEVRFDGARIDDLRDGERTRLRRESFGFVFQFNQLCLYNSPFRNLKRLEKFLTFFFLQSMFPYLYQMKRLH